MSQEKVDRNKEQKRNRKQILKKQRIQRIAGNILIAVIAVALAAWIGYSLYGKYEEKRTSTATEVDLSAITEYLSEMSQSTEDTPESADETAESTGETSESAE